MKPRRWALLDPLFFTCCALYAANRWLVKPHVAIAFFHDWFDDLLLIPCALPPVLLLHEMLRLRARSGPPGWGEIVSHLMGWSLLCEYLGPRYLHLGTADPLDALAYALGALAAGLWWHRRAVFSWRIWKDRRPSGVQQIPIRAKQ